MNMRVIYISLLMCLTTIVAFAQDSKTALPDLQTAEPDFFDPTRKVEVKEDYHFSTTWIRLGLLTAVESRLLAHRLPENKTMLSKINTFFIRCYLY